LRYRHLVDRGLFKNRQELRRLQDRQGFPLGRLLGPNTRIWTEEEIETYIASRPVMMPPHDLRGAAKIKHERKQAAVKAESSELIKERHDALAGKPPPIIASRPVMMPPHDLRGAAKIKHERKQAAVKAESSELIKERHDALVGKPPRPPRLRTEKAVFVAKLSQEVAVTRSKTTAEPEISAGADTEPATEPHAEAQSPAHI
jgi:hypothetical protein